MSIPSDLPRIPVENGKPRAKVLKELVFYKTAFSVEEHDFLIDLYLRQCPSERNRYFTIPELNFWSSVQEPALTQSARAAAQDRRPYPHFEAVRRRIADNRVYVSRLWDGLQIEVPEGSWSLEIRRLRLLKAGFHGYVRFLFPVETKSSILSQIAVELTEQMPVLSGHGGYVFTYEPSLKGKSFETIYALSQRCWGIDVEDLALTLPYMEQMFKPPCWLNIIGKSGPMTDEMALMLEGLSLVRGIERLDCAFGIVFRFGPEPAVLDTNRLETDMEAYTALSRIMGSLRLSGIGDFNGVGFLDNPGTTDEWLARFEGGE